MEMLHFFDMKRKIYNFLAVICNPDPPLPPSLSKGTTGITV